MVVSKFLVKFS